jgi:O-antigen/teichoic acid export membrane protein
MPGYAKVKHDPNALKHAFLKVLSATVTLALPASLGLFFVADLVVSIALGPKWLGASLLLQWLAISAGLRAASGTAGNLLVVIGQPKVAAIITWIEVVILVVATAVASTQSGLLGVAIAKTFVSLLSLFLYFSPVVRLRVASMSEIASMFYRPFIAAVVMAISLAALSAATSTWPSIASLATKVIVGMAVYFVILMGIWRSLGRPPGVETELVRAIDHVRGLRKRSNA